MLIRICLIVAVVAGLAVGVVNLVQVKEVITTTRTTLDNTSNALVRTEGELKTTRKTLSNTEAELAVTKQKLNTTEGERDAALADAESNRKRANQLDAKLKQTTQERDEAQADLASWKALGIPVNAVKQMIADFKEAQEQIAAQKDEIKMLSNQNRKLENDLAYYRDPSYHVKLPEGLRAKVLVFDPKWDFVVLNVGEDQGVLERGELVVSRNGKLVSRVKVFRVEKDRCIANTMTGWQVGQIVEGDAAIPAPY